MVASTIKWYYVMVYCKKSSARSVLSRVSIRVIVFDKVCKLANGGNFERVNYQKYIKESHLINKGSSFR